MIYLSFFSCSAIFGPAAEDFGLDIAVGLMVSDIFERSLDHDVLTYSEPEEVLDDRYYALVEGTSIMENDDGSYHAIINFDYRELAGLMIQDQDFCAYVETVAAFYGKLSGEELKCEQVSLAKFLEPDVVANCILQSKVSAMSKSMPHCWTIKKYREDGNWERK